ncbi:MAG: nucleotidyltransferase family protein [Candidatus Poribacteria bacterium]
MLIQLGWRCKIRDGIIEILNQQGQDIGYIKNDIFLDLHTSLRELPSSGYWANSQYKDIMSLKMRVLGYEDTLMHLCLHIYRHFQSYILLGTFGVTELIKLYDIVLLLRNFRDEINWDYIIQTSKISNSEVGLYTILNIVNRDLGEHIPDNVLKELRTSDFDLPINSLLYSNHKASKLVTFLISNKLTEHFGTTLALHNADPKKYTIFWFIGFVFRSLFPSKEYMIKRYEIKHPSLFGFYYPYRLMSALLKFLNKIPLSIRNYKRINKDTVRN